MGNRCVPGCLISEQAVLLDPTVTTSTLELLGGDSAAPWAGAYGCVP